MQMCDPPLSTLLVHDEGVSERGSRVGRRDLTRRIGLPVRMVGGGKAEQGPQPSPAFLPCKVAPRGPSKLIGRRGSLCPAMTVHHSVASATSVMAIAVALNA
jgi:hypothetical protein